MAGESLRNQLAQATAAFAGRTAASGGACVAQVWVPQPEADGSISLTTQGQPYSVSGTGDLLALFRCVSCRYRFAVGAADQPGGGLSMGAIGRVFASGEPEMSHDVQQYDRSLYIRAGEAQRCRVHASLFMPLFSSPLRDGQPVAVFEVAQAERDVLFPALIDSLVNCLQGTGLYTADATMHTMAVGLNGHDGAPPLLPKLEANSSRPAAQVPLMSRQQEVSPPVAQSEACAASDVKREGRSADAASEGTRSSSESIQTTRKRARLEPEAAAGPRSLRRGHSMPEPDTQRAPSVRSQRLRTASLLSAGSSELTGAVDHGDDRASLGAGKRLTLQQLQAQFGCGLKEAAINLGICPTTLKRACRRHGIARWPRRPALRPAKPSRTASAGAATAPAGLSDASCRGGRLSMQPVDMQFGPGSTDFPMDASAPAGSLVRPMSAGVHFSNEQPVMVLPELAGWPPMSVPVASDLPPLTNHCIDGREGIAHLLTGTTHDLGSASHEVPLGFAALGALPACCAAGPPHCVHSSFEATSFTPAAVSNGQYAPPRALGHAAPDVLPRLCDPPGTIVQPMGKQPSGQLSCSTGLTTLPNNGSSGCLNVVPGAQSLPFDQALLHDFCAGLSGMEPLLHADGLPADDAPVIAFPDMLR